MAELDPLGNTIPRFTEDEMTDILEWFEENAKPLLSVKKEAPPKETGEKTEPADKVETMVDVITVAQLQEFLALKKFHKRNFIYVGYGEIMKQLEEWKMEQFRVLTKEQFLYFLDSYVVEADLRHEMLLAFKVFDTEKRDFLDLDELEGILLNNGYEPFTIPELIEFFRDVNVKGDGQIYYEYTIESMLSVTPELAKMKVDYLYMNPMEDPSIEQDPEPEPVPEPALLPEPETVPEEVQEPLLEPPPPTPPPPAKGKDKKNK